MLVSYAIQWARADFYVSGTQVRIAVIERLQSLFKMSVPHRYCPNRKGNPAMVDIQPTKYLVSRFETLI